MNLPNKLTLLRVAIIPLCLLLTMSDLNVLAAILFITACLTDFFDGYIARKQGIVTNFGKFADPVADKILVLTMMVALLARGDYYWWAVCIVVIRELAVDGLRLVAVNQCIVIPAGNLGKIKTNIQFLSILTALLGAAQWLTLTLAVLMALFTLISGIQYFISGKDLFRQDIIKQSAHK
jgi:CDP-diacylglycerol--glycerol-3-phosphate 3-phosphatidyltransferase